MPELRRRALYECDSARVVMNSNFRNFAIWVFIGLLLVALFNLFQSPGRACPRQRDQLLAALERRRRR